MGGEDECVPVRVSCAWEVNGCIYSTRGIRFKYSTTPFLCLVVAPHSQALH